MNGLSIWIFTLMNSTADTGSIQQLEEFVYAVNYSTSLKKDNN